MKHMIYGIALLVVTIMVIAGALIVSNNKDGYYLTNDPAEAQRFARSMQHRAREILRTARAIEEAAGVD